MKKLWIFFLLTLPMLAWTQGNTSGVVTYAEVFKMEWTPPADMDPALRAQIEEMRKKMPKSFTNYKELRFDQDVAYYKVSPKQEKLDAERAAQANAEGRPGGGGFRRMMMNSNSQHYWDLKKNKYTEKREFFEREFLIKDEPKKLQWKIMGEAKQIAGYVCQKAVTMDDTMEVAGWFCPQIPVPAGPNGYGQLPGLILELVMDKGRTTYTADSIALQAVDMAQIEVPKGGKVVTRAEYDQIVKEKMAEMQAEMKSRMSSGGSGGGGHMIIRQE
jgi:GLPGLI family protein